MRVPLDWLAEFVDLPEEAQLVERLSMGGFEDVFVEATGPDLSGIVVGHVVSCERHPDADRLSVCRVDVGKDAERSIVCGAPNVAAGQKVAVALPGSRLPDGTKIKKAKLRGVVSHGMICSERELGMGEGHEGIWVLDPGAPLGVPLPDVVGAATRVLDVSLTPNRGDAASLLGLAREVRAHFGGEIRVPPHAPPETGAAGADAVSIRIEAPAACFHYVGRVVRGVRVGPSPEALRARLEAAGIRSINNVVDVTNLVLLEFGQPLHAFDLARLGGGEVRVRRASAGEKLVTLDGETRELDPRDLLIADAERAVALAGVMGGADSEVGDATRDVLIESAHFHPSDVRLAARRHGLHSEASYRFERGVDPEGVVRAADRAARLLAEWAGGEVAPGAVEVRGDARPAVPPIELRVERTNRLLGLSLEDDEVRALLGRVGVEARTQGPGRLECRVPSHRNDLRVPQDLAEEVARIHGYEKIPTTLPIAPLAPARVPASHRLAERTRDLLAAAGLVEVVSFPFVSEADLAALEPETPAALRLRNPLQEQDAFLRTRLLPSLLRLVRQNLSRQVADVGLFEVARVFEPVPGVPEGPGEEALPRETLWAAGAISEEAGAGLWSPNPPPLFFRAKAIAEKALFGLGYVTSLRRAPAAAALHPGASVEFFCGEVKVASVGELHPEVAARFDLEPACAVFELNLSALLAVKQREFEFREVSKEPSVRRDLALLVDRAQPAGALADAIRSAAGDDLVSCDVFDRYEGRGVPEGRVSLAFRLIFQRADRTLTDAEVGSAVERVVEALTERFGAELR